MPKMHKKISNAAQRAWNLLRLVLVYRHKFMMDVRLCQKFLKTLTHSSNRNRRALPYGERELSFEKTPIIHIKMHRPSSMRFKMPKIPCINPQNEFDYDYDYDYEEATYESHNRAAGNRLSGSWGMACIQQTLSDPEIFDEEARRSFLMSGEDDRIESEVVDGDEGIDLKAEEFIANFYTQLKMQRQVSYLQYNEMLNRGTA